MFFLELIRKKLNKEFCRNFYAYKNGQVTYKYKFMYDLLENIDLAKIIRKVFNIFSREVLNRRNRTKLKYVFIILCGMGAFGIFMTQTNFSKKGI